jgi:hypothetical protein
MDDPVVATERLRTVSPRSPEAGPPGGEGRADPREFLLVEYQAYREALNENERTGEGRVNLFLTITTAVLGALALKGDLTEAGGDFDALFLFLLLVVFLFGVTTLARMLHRKRVAHEMKAALSTLRAYFCEANPEIVPYLAWKPREVAKLPEIGPLTFIVPGNGGLVDATALLNSAVFGALATMLAVRIGGSAVVGWTAWGAAVGGFVLAWAGQVFWVRRVYARLEKEEGR